MLLGVELIIFGRVFGQYQAAKISSFSIAQNRMSHNLVKLLSCVDIGQCWLDWTPTPSDDEKVEMLHCGQRQGQLDLKEKVEP